MIIDTSAILAILAAEPEADRFKRAIVTNDVKTSAASFLEAAIVLDSRGSAELSAELDRFLSTARASIEPVTAIPGPHRPPGLSTIRSRLRSSRPVEFR